MLTLLVAFSRAPHHVQEAILLLLQDTVYEDQDDLEITQRTVVEALRPYVPR